MTTAVLVKRRVKHRSSKAYQIAKRWGVWIALVAYLLTALVVRFVSDPTATVPTATFTLSDYYRGYDYGGTAHTRWVHHGSFWAFSTNASFIPPDIRRTDEYRNLVGTGLAVALPHNTEQLTIRLTPEALAGLLNG